MKSNRWLLAQLSATLLLGSANAFAQPAPLNPPMIAPPPAPRAKAPLDEANWRAIRVQNVRPSMIAYQLDPAHNTMPAFWNIPWFPGMECAANYKEPKRIKGPFDLPDEMRLAASDEQNLIFVADGNAQQIARLQELVDIFDQPLRLVEIEAQIVELPVENLKDFGLASNAATAGNFQFGFARDDFQKRLNDLLADNKARVISTKPQIIANNIGLAVSLRSGPIDNTGANQYKMPAAPAEGTDTIVTLTPTVNNDNTITVLMNVATLPQNINASGLETVVNLRDGQTGALTGLKASAFPRLTNPKIPMLDEIPMMDGTTQQKIPLLHGIPIIGKLFRSKKLEDANTVLLLVTARLVRTDEK